MAYLHERSQNCAPGLDLICMSCHEGAFMIGREK